MKRRERRHSIAGAFVFLLLGVFAVFSTMLVLFGAQAYRGMAERAERHNEERIAHAYLVNALRADDGAGAIEVREESGRSVVAVRYAYEGAGYVKRIYCEGGALRELFTEEARAFDPEEGQKICDAERLEAWIEDGLVTLKVTDAEGREELVQEAPRAAK